jgi:hypothetical protein
VKKRVGVLETTCRKRLRNIAHSSRFMKRYARPSERHRRMWHWLGC